MEFQLSFRHEMIYIAHPYIVKAHQLRVRGIFVVAVADVDHRLLLDLTEH